MKPEGAYEPAEAICFGLPITSERKTDPVCHLLGGGISGFSKRGKDGFSETDSRTSFSCPSATCLSDVDSVFFPFMFFISFNVLFVVPGIVLVCFVSCFCVISSLGAG